MQKLHTRLCLPDKPLPEVCLLHHMQKPSDPSLHMGHQQHDSLPVRSLKRELKMKIGGIKANI